MASFTEGGSIRPRVFDADPDSLRGGIDWVGCVGQYEGVPEAVTCHVAPGEGREINPYQSSVTVERYMPVDDGEISLQMSFNVWCESLGFPVAQFRMKAGMGSGTDVAVDVPFIVGAAEPVAIIADAGFLLGFTRKPIGYDRRGPMLDYAVMETFSDKNGDSEIEEFPVNEPITFGNKRFSLQRKGSLIVATFGDQVPVSTVTGDQQDGNHKIVPVETAITFPDPTNPAFAAPAEFYRILDEDQANPYDDLRYQYRFIKSVREVLGRLGYAMSARATS